jgi:hypothetical protein
MAKHITRRASLSVEFLEGRLVPSAQAVLGLQPVALAGVRPVSAVSITASTNIVLAPPGPTVYWDPPIHANGAVPGPNVESGPKKPDILWDPPKNRTPPPNVASGPTFNPNGPEPYRLWERGPDGELYPLGQGPPGSVPLGAPPPAPSKGGNSAPTTPSGPTFNPNGPEPYRLWVRGPDGNIYPLGLGPPGSVPLGTETWPK